MKFEHDKARNIRECVAYLHSTGALFFNCEETYSRNGLKQGAVAIGGKHIFGSKFRPNGTSDIYEVIENDGHRGVAFFPGDKITITF